MGDVEAGVFTATRRTGFGAGAFFFAGVATVTVGKVVWASTTQTPVNIAQVATPLSSTRRTKHINFISTNIML